MAPVAGETLEHVIIDHTENLTKLSLEPRTNPFKDWLQLGIREVGREVLDGLEIVEGLDSTVGLALGREDLEKGSRVVPQDLELGTLV